MQRLCPGILPVGVARLDDHRFTINRQGFATVVPEAGSVVHGVVWEALENHLPLLDAFEGVPEGLYDRTALMVVMEGEARQEALVYITRDAEPGSPARSYMEMIVAGALHFGLPTEYIDALRKIRPAPVPGSK